MDNTFELKKGRLVFEEDKIIITDNARYQRRYRLFSAVILLSLGILYIVKYLKTGDMHSLRFVLIIGVAGLISFVIAFFSSDQSEIYLKDVKSMKIKRIFFKEFLQIKLTNNKTRQVAGIYNAERLQEYIETNFDKK
jgi:hypothetical protein